jgi:hypothetical protein
MQIVHETLPQNNPSQKKRSGGEAQGMGQNSNSNIKKEYLAHKRAGRVAQKVKHLPSKHEAMSSTSAPPQYFFEEILAHHVARSTLFHLWSLYKQ